MGWADWLNFQIAPTTKQVCAHPICCLNQVYENSTMKARVKKRRSSLRHKGLSQVQGDKPLGLLQERNANKSLFKALTLHWCLQVDLQRWGQVIRKLKDFSKTQSWECNLWKILYGLTHRCMSWSPKEEGSEKKNVPQISEIWVF